MSQNQGLNGPFVAGAANPAAVTKAAAATSKSTTKNTGSSKKEKKDTVLVSGLPYNTPQQKELIDKCDWMDKFLYGARMLMGGNNVNGFLRGCATAQRIKKQRARQVASTKKPTPGAPPGADGTDAEKKTQKPVYNQEEEEKLKKGKISIADWRCARLCHFAQCFRFQCRHHESKDGQETQR